MCWTPTDKVETDTEASDLETKLSQSITDDTTTAASDFGSSSREATQEFDKLDPAETE